MILKTIQKINHQRFQRRLHRLEQMGNDDLLLIQEAGPRDYSTQELYHLLQVVNQQGERLGKMRQRMFFLAALLSLWTGGAFLAMALRLPTLGYLLLVLLAGTLGLVVVGQVRLRYQHRRYQRAGRVAGVIQWELERRRKDASIF